jgi:biotin carboxyl carrier protein
MEEKRTARGSARVRFEVEAAGKTRTVEITRQKKGFLVHVDGQARHVDVASTGRSWSLLIGARSYEIAFVEQPGGAMMVHVNGQSVGVSLGQAGRTGRTSSGTPTVQAGPQRVVAPMPGRILKVLVKTGDPVTARQGLVVVEAMKMENELRSPRAGTVAEVRVTEGMSVEANTVLVVVD